MFHRKYSHNTDEQVIASVVGRIVPASKPPARRKPSRCVGCGRVSKHVFCADCAKGRR